VSDVLKPVKMSAPPVPAWPDRTLQSPATQNTDAVCVGSSECESVYVTLTCIVVNQN
jgi:hypothetical protein